MNPPFRYGFEEEFFIVDATTARALVTMPGAFWESAQRAVPSVSKELLQSQIEIQTDPCATPAALLGQLC